MQEFQPVAAIAQICPRCGAEFSGAGGLKNLCPRCLMQSVLADSSAADENDLPGELSPSTPASDAEADRKRATGFQFRTGDRVLDAYTIVAPVGRGGFGEVYHGRSDAGKDVALKIVQRFLEVELRGVGHCLNLKHPNLVTLFDARADTAGQHWIVMEFVAGQSLAHAIDRTPNGLPVEEILHWLEGIAAAVEHLHEAGIVHRDLKPSNIFDDRGTVKVGDYGLSKFITASRRSGQTQSIGTLHYMAPEIGCGRYGREVDVYAVGIMLYEMLTGDVPFDGETPAEILMKHLTAGPDLNKLPPAFRGIVGRMLAKRPEERYGSLRAVLADLKARLADAATAEFESGEDLPFYSSPGLSTWLEAPLATFQQQFAGARPDPPDRDADVREIRTQQRPRTAITIYPAHKAVFLFVALIAIVFPLYFAAEGEAPFIFAIPLVLVGLLIAWTAADAWAAFLRKRNRTPNSAVQRSEWHGEPGSVARGSLADNPLRFIWTGLCGLLTFVLLASPIVFWLYLSAGSGTGVFLNPLWVAFGVVLTICAWMLLFRGRQGEPGGLHPEQRGLKRQHAWQPPSHPAVPRPPLQNFGEHSFAASPRASDREQIQDHNKVPDPAPAPPGTWLGVLGAILIALFWGVGAGLLVAGTTLLIWPRADEMALVSSIGSGFFVAGVIALRCLFSVTVSAFLRLVAALFFGACAGVMMFGWGLAMEARDEIAFMQGAGAGLVIAGLLSSRLFTRRPEWLLPRAFAGLLTGTGAGLLSAGILIAIDARPDEFVALVSLGIGFFVVGGAIWFRLLLHTRRYAFLRALAALFTGAGVGFLVAAVTLLGAPDEAAACLGFGAGFMACGIAAYNLFAVPRIRPAR